MRFVPDRPYRDDPRATPAQRERCRLDLYLPAQGTPFPLVLWFHGGGLTGGDKSQGTEPAFARQLVRDGIGLASAAYRLAPGAGFEEIVSDAAAAAAYLLRHAADLGADPNRFVMAGYSAGAYLALMATLDRRFLRDAGVDARRVAGLISLSGQTVTHSAIRLQRGVPDAGSRPTIDDAAPCYHARADAPPTLLIAGDRDMPLRAQENRYFAAVLKAAGHPDVTYLEIADRDHGTVHDRMTQTPDDPCYRAIVGFVRRLKPVGAP